jgi:alkane 1-monooxygenase
MQNEVITAWAMTAALFLLLSAFFGFAILPWLVVQAIVGLCLLEVVNYIEHYGLARQKRPDGRYEPCAPRHSWNSNTVASNVMLFHLQRHADHHSCPSRSYQALCTFAEAPELPSGYGTMVAIALIPPLWRRLMDPKVIAQYGGDLSLANIQPSKRRKYVAVETKA